METTQQPNPVVHSKEPTWWDDFVMWWLIGPVGGALIVIALLFAAGPILGYINEHVWHSHFNAGTPAEFNQEFFTWAYNQGKGLDFACRYSGGVVWLEDGQCHDSESARYPYLQPSR